MYYKGHGEVKVDIMLLFIANNCWTRSFALEYWLLYFSSVFDSDEEKKPLQVKDCLKWVCMLPYLFLPYWGQSIFVIVGSYIVLNQLIYLINHGEAHEINTWIVFAFKSELPHEVYT
jgi:hypothetical protein